MDPVEARIDYHNQSTSNEKASGRRRDDLVNSRARNDRGCDRADLRLMLRCDDMSGCLMRADRLPEREDSILPFILFYLGRIMCCLFMRNQARRCLYGWEVAGCEKGWAEIQ